MPLPLSYIEDGSRPAFRSSACGLGESVGAGIVDTQLTLFDLGWPYEARDSLAERTRRAARARRRAVALSMNSNNRIVGLSRRRLIRGYGLDDYLTDLQELTAEPGTTVDSVLVAAPTRDGLTDPDTASFVMWVESLGFGAAGAPSLLGVIAHADPRDDGFGPAIDTALMTTSSLRGIRMGCAWHPDPKVTRFASRPKILLSPDFLRSFAAVAERDLLFEVPLYSHQLRDMLAPVREYPESTFVLEYAALAPGLFGPVGERTGVTAAARAELLRRWREDMAALAHHPNVMVKLAGLAHPLLGYGPERRGNIGSQETLAEMIGPLIDFLLLHFGPRRLMFATGFPIDRANATVPMLAGAVYDTLQPRGESVLRKVFRDNALSLYSHADGSKTAAQG
ncbi:hypothetical protein GCM10027169_28320 [Gordonia jinhuaensis]|uniref:Amidohydrolase-related domain-containing protein n=1 Tax=Gordonia jinhuaensis TaxID=1517702 RepID=A0A916T909_9ACTN|nr:amidohydrolase family protein [Gordonia jinhuaensis]GGB36237.1 hypothetical protein GCM10011489_25280 [Gordonia jinhuaensis]